MNWGEIQEAINRCEVCRPSGTSLQPTRAPAPIPGRPLIITEAPPEAGGFWKDSTPPDQLRRALFSILREGRPEFRDLSLGSGGREVFRRHLFLIQTLKWPLQRRAGALGPKVRKAIRHAVEAHMVHELREIRPSGILASGAVAGLACCLLAPRSGLCEFFSGRGFEGGVVGQRFEGEFPGLGRLPVYFTHLLVDRFVARARPHVLAFLEELLGPAGDVG